MHSRHSHPFPFASIIAASTLFTCLTGCTTSKFQDASPSVRTFSDSGRTRTNEYYVGLDLDFAVDDDAPHVPAPSNAAGPFP
jgi:hypothetical protein